MLVGLLESLATKLGLKLAQRAYEWSKGSEAKRLTNRLQREHPAASKLLLQPDALGELWLFASTGKFDHDAMLVAVSAVESDPEAAAALASAIESTQWMTKKREEHTHWEILKLRFDLRRELTDATAPVLERLEHIDPREHVDRPVPPHLPRVGRSFTNRVEERRQLNEALAPLAGADAEGSAVVVALVGVSGVGKSMLALRVAHDVATHYSDGQLYTNLRATDGTLIHPGDAAAELLRQLGTPASRIPVDAAERASALRSEMMGKRMLLLLDNAAEHPLLPQMIPASASCGTILTSHVPLRGVDTDLELRLDVLAEKDALDLLEAVAGGGRTEADFAVAVDLVGLCRSLPVLLRAVADWLRASPEASLGDAVARLRKGGVRRLGAGSVQPAVHAVV